MAVLLGRMALVSAIDPRMKPMMNGAAGMPALTKP